MVQYSKEFLAVFLDQQWLSDYTMVKDAGYTETELEEFFQKAVSGELLKDKVGKKRIQLPASAYLRLSKYETKTNDKVRLLYENAPPFTQLQESRYQELLSSLQFHDAYITGLEKKSGNVILSLLPDGEERSPCTISLYKAQVLENELPGRITPYLDEDGDVCSDYWWYSAEAIINNDNKNELHLAVSSPQGYLKPATEFEEGLCVREYE